MDPCPVQFLPATLYRFTERWSRCLFIKEKSHADMAFIYVATLRFRLSHFPPRVPLVYRGYTTNAVYSRLTSVYGVKQECKRQSVPAATTTTMASVSVENGQLIDKVLNYWFGKTEFERFETLDSKMDLWYQTSKETDDEIRDKFEKNVERALEGEYDGFADHPEHSIKPELALIVMLDQFTRNIYRGGPRAFAGDTKSRQIVHGILESDRWKHAEDTLPVVVRMSFMLPLMHQESLPDHDLCIKYIKGMLEESKAQGEKAKDCVKAMEQCLQFAETHRGIIERFGRYPYRNKTLGRQSTEEEEEFLKDGPRFGQ